jgi:glutamyl-tRNA synthetase
MDAPRLRFAPSPTGELHVGNARTALFNWFYARRWRGALVLRIEDTDTQRSLPEHEARLIEDLRWLGLGWDEGIEEGGPHGPYRQSERLALYGKQVEDLIGRGAAYPCFCSPDVLEAERAAQREAGRASLYTGRCRRLPPAEAAARRGREAAAIRLDVQAIAGGDPAIAFTDLVHGAVRFPLAQIGDFVLLRPNGWPSYNFAVVVDDLAMRISHVVRGDDHLSNTPRQILVYRALGGSASQPQFAHLPLITGPGGAPLSKREGSASVAWFRGQGYPPEALTNYLALLGWSAPDGRELLTREEMIEMFGLDRISRSPAVFDPRKLDALSARHMARLPPERLASLAVEQLRRAGLLGAPEPPEAWSWAARLALLYAERLPRMADLPAEAAFLFDFSADRSLADPHVRETLSDPRARRVVEALSARLGSEPLTAPRFQAIAEEVRRETGARGKELYHPMRVALTGSASGPELVKLLPVIEEGARLPLPRRIAPCAERVRRLLEAAAGSRG